MTNLLDELTGESAIVVGGGEGIVRRIRERFARVYAAEPSHSLASSPTIRQLRERGIDFISEGDARDGKLPSVVDCVILAFQLGQVDRPEEVLQAWSKPLAERGRLVVLEWPAASRNTPDTAHHKLLDTLEEHGRIRRLSARQLTGLLRSSGLIHVRQSRLEGEDLFEKQDIAFMVADGLRMLGKLGLADSDLAGELRSARSNGLVLQAAWGLRKAPRRVEDLRTEAGIEADSREAAEQPEPAGAAVAPGGDSSLVDLLARVIGPGDGNRDLARRLVGELGAKALTALRSAAEVKRVLPLGDDQARRLLDALQLGRRLFVPADHEIHGPEDAWQVLGAEMSTLNREYFRGLYLNVKGGLVADEVISIGTLTASLVHPREVFEPAITRHCHSVLVAHNHPTGDPTPSAEDIRITRELAEAGRLLGIELLDHLVIGHDRYISMKERGHF